MQQYELFDTIFKLSAVDSVEELEQEPRVTHEVGHHLAERRFCGNNLKRLNRFYSDFKLGYMNKTNFILILR